MMCANMKVLSGTRFARVCEATFAVLVATVPSGTMAK